MTGQPKRTGARHSASKPPPTLNVHIQDLVLHGFGSIDHHRIGEAMEHELARLFLAQGVPRSLASSIAVDLLDAGVLKIGSAAAPEPIGIQLARAIHETLSRKLSPPDDDRERWLKPGRQVGSHLRGDRGL
jgi:hypothetical protein